MAQHRFQDRKSVARTLLSLFLLPLVFDVRISNGSFWLRYYQIFEVVFCTAIFLLIVRVFKTRQRLPGFAGNRINIIALMFFVGAGMLSGLMHHNRTFLVFSHSVTSVLFIYSLVIISLFAQAEIKLRDIIDILIFFALLTIVLHAPIEVLLYHLNLSTVRYQILSGATAIGSAYLLARLASGYRLGDAVFAVVQVMIILLAVTRIEVLAILGMGTILVISLPAAMWKLKRMALFLAAGISAAGLLLALDLLLPGNAFERWIHRTSSLSGHQVDLSGLARIAQLGFEVKKYLGGNVFEKLFGFGLAAPGGNSPILEAYIMKTTGSTGSFVPTGFPDHTYIALIFLAGLVGGLPLLLVQFSWAWNALRGTMDLLRSGSKVQAWYAVMPLAVIGYQIENLTGSTFRDRPASVYFGFCVGIIGWLAALRKAAAKAKVMPVACPARREYPESAMQ